LSRTATCLSDYPCAGVVCPGMCRQDILFFFQAEDGIRDRNVTGVQTCALPIFGRGLREGPRAVRAAPGARRAAAGGVGRAERLRSEERRVGKECRSRWWRER